MKKVLLLAPNDYSLYRLIKKNLENLHFQVEVIHHNYNFKYKNVFQRLKNVFYKIILNEKTYKNKLKNEFNLHIQKEIISNQKFDITLVLRFDFFTKEILEYCKKRTDKFVVYQYDGLSRIKSNFENHILFDKIYVFNLSDITNYPTLPLVKSSNFYFDYINPKSDKIGYDFYFLGGFHPSRIDIINRLTHYFQLKNFKYLFEIYFDPKDVQFIELHNDITPIYDFIDYEVYLEKLKNASNVVDILIEEHEGLSFRVFESLYFEKKLITTNPTVVTYDFYNENNIFVLNSDNLNEVENFLAKDKVKIDNELIKNYSFSNWFRNISQ